MPALVVRIDEQTKRRMRKLTHINWSEVVRKAVQRVLEDEEGRNIARAVLLNEGLRRKPSEGWDSVQVIRYWREHRYGRASH